MEKSTVVILICCAYFGIMILVGIFVMARNRKASDFLVAGRKLSLPFTVATLSAVQIGAGIILGGSTTGASMGIWPGMWYSLGCGGGLIIAGILVAGKLRQKENFVPLDFFEKRYGSNKWIRLWAWMSNVPSLLGIFFLLQSRFRTTPFCDTRRQRMLKLPGWFLNDWRLSTNLEGLFVAGDSLYASNCYGHAAATGHYAGRHASEYAAGTKRSGPDKNQVTTEKERVYSPIHNRPSDSIGWKELNMGISKIMKNYCGEVKHDELLKIGLKQLKDYESSIASETYAYNPHELIRLLEVFNILTVSEIIINSCLRRKSNSKPRCFVKYNSSEISDAQMLITIRKTGSEIVTRELNTDFFGDLNENYEKHNKKYINEKNRNGR